MPAIVPETLNREQCRLLSKYSDNFDDVLKEYNSAIALARVLAAKFPQVIEHPDLRESLARLQNAHDTLTTPRFKVGFLGPFQCGKSTTMNNLLGQKVSGTGAGKATTSVITCLIPTPPNTEPKLELQYFSDEEYRRRRNTLCEWIRLPNAAGQSETQLLEKLRNHNPNRVGGSSQRPVLKDDIPYLQAFLQSFDDCRTMNLIRSEGYTETVRFEDKNQLLTHDNEEDGRTKPSRYLLLSRATISYPTDRIDPELELVDCPGLGANRSVDTLLTKEYIPSLNGALVFLRASAIYSGEAIEILNDLKEAFRDNLKARVWVVVNQMDTPSTEAKLEGDKGKTTFDLIAELESQHGIPLSQVCLGCNDIFALASHSETGAANRREALLTIKLREEHERSVKDRLAKYPALASAFETMLKDGSVSHLGNLIKSKIGPSVARELLTQVREDARLAASELQFALKQAEQPINEEEQRNAIDWENTLYILLAQLSVGKQGVRGQLFLKLEELGRSARSSLEKSFLSSIPDEVLMELNTADLIGRFRVDATRMQKEIGKELDRIVQSAYGEVTSHLEAKKLPPITLTGGRDILTAWHDIRQLDRDDSEWRLRSSPRLDDPELLMWLADEDLQQILDGNKYKQLILNKLRTSAYQLTLAVRGQLRFRLGSMRREVSRKLGPAAATPANAS